MNKNMFTKNVASVSPDQSKAMFYKQSPCEFKDLTDSGEFEGYAAAFNNKDHGGDVIVPGAFSDFIKEFPANRVKILLQHDWHRPIGKGASLAEDDYGLKVHGKILRKTTDGEDTYQSMKEGILDRLSIGYYILEDKYDSETETRYLLKLGMPEFSVVTFAMNDNAVITVVKSNETLFSDLDGAKSTREVEYILKGAQLKTVRGDLVKLSRETARFFASRFKISVGQRDAGEPGESGRDVDSIKAVEKSLIDLALTLKK